jgi:hypothetical protein
VLFVDNYRENPKFSKKTGSLTISQIFLFMNALNLSKSTHMKMISFSDYPQKIDLYILFSLSTHL